MALVVLRLVDESVVPLSTRKPVPDRWHKSFSAVCDAEITADNPDFVILCDPPNKQGCGMCTPDGHIPPVERDPAEKPTYH
jgi:hypothetical protein